MKKNSLSPNQGLSLSQAQSISNLCNQRANEIANGLAVVNNYKKSVTTEGHSFITVAPVKLPDNVIELVIEKAKLNACQAFLMENIKAKDEMLKAVKSAHAVHSLVMPVEPKMNHLEVLSIVDESFGWEQLTSAEVCENIEAEAYASQIGQFIHKDSVLDKLRRELPNIPSVEWMVIKDGVKTPVNIAKHHNSDDLLAIHEKFAELHRGYEQRVNYYKAKVKNLTTLENARIAKVNADVATEVNKQNELLRTEWQNAVKSYGESVQEIRNEFEKERQNKIREIASMRIDVDLRFQTTINLFLKKISDTQEDKE